MRRGQDPGLLSRLDRTTSTLLPSLELAKLFYVAPMDILLREQDGVRRFQLTELNGTGIGGFTNLPLSAIGATLAAFGTIPVHLRDACPVILVANSGRELDHAPKQSRLLHEKVLYVESLKLGLQQRFGAAAAVSLDALVEAGRFEPRVPTVVLGYTKDFVRTLEVRDGRLWLFGVPVSAAVNDRFVLNLVSRHGAAAIDFSRLFVANGSFAVGGDKALAYKLANEYLSAAWHPHVDPRIHYDLALDRRSLIDAVRASLADGRRVVIKPCGTGQGDGIEFFLGGERTEEIVARIDGALETVRARYAMAGAGFPYTVCEYLDVPTIRPGHALSGHKFELRIVVYRDGLRLRAAPSIAKIAPVHYDAKALRREMLLMNITPAAATRGLGAAAADLMRPLCNEETLALLGISERELEDLCRFATGYVAHVLRRVHDDPFVEAAPAKARTQADAQALQATLAAPSGTAADGAPMTVAA